MTLNEYDPIGGHTKEEADAAYAELFRELHGEDFEEKETHAERVAVVGHKEPDTDSICSAIAYARLKNELDPKSIYTPFRAGCISDETAFVLRYFETAEPPLLTIEPQSIDGFESIAESDGSIKTSDTPETLSVNGLKFILVDHNGSTQMQGCIDMADVIEIVDHHRLSGNETPIPIRVICEPYGATSTIVYKICKENGIIPDRKTAGLLCAAIISDTLLFKTPATTRHDRLAGAELAGIAGLDMEVFAAEMFSALRDIKNLY